MQKRFTVSIIGCGSRGGYIYGQLMHSSPEHFKIVSLCDINNEHLRYYAAKFDLLDGDLFNSEEAFFQKKRSDVIVIATQDRDHVRMCIKAMELGYDILMEKPISPIKEELMELLRAQEKYKRKVLICHVLRYAPAFLKAKEILDSGKIGRLVMIDAVEQVAYWHQAHSFVRGNWRNDKTTSPMIMQKCCHDLDLLQYYAGSLCENIYSTGNLTFFNEDNKPDGAADCCSNCKYINECAYSAERLYIERWKIEGSKPDDVPYNIIAEAPLTEGKLREAYKKGMYGRCVFACDNNVVDNQTINIVFKNGVKANLTMTAFTYELGRRYVFYGTYGEIELVEDRDLLLVKVFGKPIEEYKISTLISVMTSYGHGGGDNGLINSFYNVLTGLIEPSTSLEKSIESHLMALAAEESRITGKVIKVHE